LAADLEMARELIGSTKLKSTNGETEISSFQPKTKEEFDEFSTRLATIITAVGSSPQYPMFLAGLVKAIAEPLSSDDVKKVTSGLTTLGNEKLKAEKAAGGKAKKGKKPALAVGTAKSVAAKFDTTDYSRSGFDDDDDDFMVSNHRL
jgi:translation initiation factor 3 subunit J